MAQTETQLADFVCGDQQSINVSKVQSDENEC